MCLTYDKLLYWRITVLCHFRKNDKMPVISCLISLTCWSLFYVISIPFCPKTCFFPCF